MKQSSYGDYVRNRLERYRILMQHREYRDRLFWSRIQILHLIQAGVLAGSFYLAKQGFAIIFPSILLFLGVILTITLLVMCKYDWSDATRNEKELYSLGDTLGIRWSAERWRIFGHTIRGHILLYGVFTSFIIMDLYLLFCCNFYWAIATTILIIILIAFVIVGKRYKILTKENGNL